jgi:uncharacterized protein (DUF302 family)
MRRFPLFLAMFLAVVLASPLAVPPEARAADGVIHVTSPYSVKETGRRLHAALKAKDMTIFKVVNHAKGARSVGIQLRPTMLMIFGNPRAGTPLMKCAQTAALDLPQKALIWKDADGQVRLSYNDPAWVAARHGIDGCEKALDNISRALAAFARAATR